MHQRKLNIYQTISISSVYRASIFTIMGVTYEGMEEVASLSHLKLLIYFSKDMGWAWSSRECFIFSS